MKRKFPTRTVVTRASLHTPLGALTVWAGEQHWVFALVLMFTFLAYEVTEDWRIRDNAYIDIRSFLAGFVVALVGFEIPL